MNLPRQSVRLYIASVLDCTLLQYLIAEDKSNYELLYDDDEEMDTMVATIDAKSSFHRSTHVRRLVPRDHANGEARIIRHYFADNPMYTPGQFRRRYRTWHIKFLSFCQYVSIAYIFKLAGSV